MRFALLRVDDPLVRQQRGGSWSFAARAHEAHIHLPGAHDAGAGRLVEQTRVSGPANPLSGAGAPQPESRKGSLGLCFGLVFWVMELG